MRNTLKKGMGILMVAVLLAGVLAVPSQGVQAASASKNYMKTLGLRWDLKKGRTVTCNSLFAGVGKKKKAVTYKITKYKVGNARKKGYKKLTLTCVNAVAYKPTKNEIHKMTHSSHFKKTGIVGANGDSVVLDYNTGISLTKKNKFNVEVNCSNWKSMKSRIYKDHDGCYVDFGNLKQTITITYPEDYDGLCIGFYADNQLTKTKADKKFQKGKTLFGKTSYYKKGKKNSHWMRVRASKKKQPTVTSKPKATKTPVPTVSPSGNTSVPTVSPSGNVQATTAPTLMPSPSGDVTIHS